MKFVYGKKVVSGRMVEFLKKLEELFDEYNAEITSSVDGETGQLDNCGFDIGINGPCESVFFGSKFGVDWEDIHEINKEIVKTDE